MKEERSLRLMRVAHFPPIFLAYPDDTAAFLAGAGTGNEFQSICILREALFKRVHRWPGQFGDLNDQPHLRIDGCRARTEIQRAYEQSASVNGKRLGVQSGLRRLASGFAGGPCVATGGAHE